MIGKRRDERGAAAVFMGLIMCFVILPLTALTVDIGMQRVARRDAQAIADTSAQDAARALGGGTTAQADLLAVARSSAAANAGYVGNQTTPTVNLFVGTLSTSSTDFVADQSLGCNGTGYNSYFKQTPSGSKPNAVLVTVSNVVDFNFVPGKSGGVCRSAIATARKSACMVMDSYAAALRSNDSTVLGPLTKILDTNIDTTVLGDSGILSTDIDVLKFLDVLKTQLNLGSTDQVLAANITAAQLLQAQATALTQQGASSTAISALNSQITSNLGPLANKQPGINVGELLGITQGGDSALGTTVNAFDLAAAGVQLANGTNAVAGTVALPAGLTGATKVDVKVGSRPLRVCLGEPKKTMGQTSVSVNANVLSPGSLVGDLVSSLTGLVSGVLCSLLGPLTGSDCYSLPTVSIGPATATVSLASASGEVTSLSCTGRVPNSMDVRESASLAPATFSIPLVISQTRTYGSIFNRKSETVTSTLTISGTTQGKDKSVPATLSVDKAGDYDRRNAGPSGDLSVTGLTLGSSLVSDGKFGSGNSVLGSLVGGVNAVVNSISQNLLTPLLSSVADPLLKALTKTLQDTVGLTVAGSTYTPLRTPACATPSLVG